MIARKCVHVALSPLPFLAIFLVLASINSIFLYPLFLALLTQFFFLYFFRDMPRKIGDGIISPADGRIINAEDGRVAIFMSLLDMHVNFMPYDGKIVRMKHYDGGHAPAYGDAGKNERMEIDIESSVGKIKVIQIAGMVARRIVPYIKEGDVMKKGDKIGIIRFGSRVDVLLPENCKMVVKKGQKIKAGETLAWQER